MNIILLGAPGAGKGFVSNYIIENYGLTHISTGNLLRDNINNKTELGEKIKTFMESGELVPDELVLSVLKDKLQKVEKNAGIIFDGYPRKLEQAKELEKLVDIDLVICVEVPETIILDRLSSRRTCASCSEVYNYKTYTSSICKKCGGKVIQRSDDVPEVIQNRLKKYEEQTKPLIEFYKKQGKLVSLDNSGDSNETFSRLQELIK